MSKAWYKHYPEHIATEFPVPDITLIDMLNESVSKFSEHPSTYFYGNKMTFKELGALVNRFTAALQQKGTQKGDRIALMLPNCPQYLISYYGALQAGGIITQINPMLVGKELEYLLNDSGADTIVVYEPLLPVLKEVIEKTSVKTVIKVTLQEQTVEEEIAIDFNDFIKSSSDEPIAVLLDPREDVAVLQYTGGTTGRSKGVMLTHRNLVSNVLQTYEFFKDGIEAGKDRVLTVIPLFHVYGMTSCMNLSIYTGSMNILLPRFELEEVLETIHKAQPTSFPGVPTMYIGLLNHPKMSQYNLDSIRRCNSGSAPMPVEVMRKFEAETGAQILEGYGLSETAPTTHVNPLFSTRKPGSVGIGVPNTDYKIVDLGDGTTELPPNENGEIIIKGPQVMKGYWNNPEETEIALRDGWFYTGDIGYMDDDGYLYIVDRKKDLIIASGFNVYPRDVEEVLYEHPKIQEAVVIGVPDAYRGETVKAVLVVKEGETCTEEEIIEYCRTNLANYKVPRIIEFREELPKTAVGKILRWKIREEVRK